MRFGSVFGLAPITLEVYAGPKPKAAKDCLDKLVKDVRGMEMLASADVLKKAGCRVSCDFKLGVSDKETITKVVPKAKDHVEL